jgi:ankyrin repeat protein
MPASLYPELNNLNYKTKENEVTSGRNQQVDINAPAYTSPFIMENDQYSVQNNKTLAEDVQFNGGSMSKETSVISTLANRVSDTANFIVDFGMALTSPEDNLNHMKAPGSEHDEFIAFSTIDFNKVKGALKKAIDENDYSELDEIVSNMGKSTQEENTTLDQPDYGLSYRSIDCVQENEVDTPIDEGELDNGELGHFCSSILKLNRKLVHHENARKKIIERASKQENGSKNYSVREIVLLAIAANDKLTEKYKGVLLEEKLDEDLEELLIGVGRQEYIGTLLERLERALENDRIDPWRDICKTLKMTLSIENQECAKAILDKFKDIKAQVDARLPYSPSMSSKLLHYAIHNGYTDVAKFIVKCNSVNVNSVDNNGYTPLHHAVIRNNSGLVDLLIKNGANVDAKSTREDRTALHMAAHGCKLEIAKQLVNEGADWSIEDNENNTALDLVSKGAELQESYKKESYNKADADQLTKLLKGLDDKTPLYYAVENGNYNTAEKLLKGGADVNERSKDGWTPLSRAIIGGHFELVELLLNHNANVNIEAFKDGDKSSTHLYWAIQRANPDAKNAKEKLEIVKLLLEKNANIGPLELKEALTHGNIAVMRLLVRNGADITEEVLDEAKKALEDCKKRYENQWTSNGYVQRYEKVVQFLEGAFSARLGAAKKNIPSAEYTAEDEFVDAYGVGVPQLKKELESIKSQFEKKEQELNNVKKNVSQLEQEKLSQQTKINGLTAQITQLKEEINSKQDLVNETSEVTQLSSKNGQLQAQIQNLNAELEKMKTQESKLRKKEQELVNKTEELNSKSDKNTRLSASSVQSGKYSNYASASFVLAGIFAVGTSLTIPYLAICITLAVAASVSLIVGSCCLYKANTALSDVKADQIASGANVGANMV